MPLFSGSRLSATRPAETAIPFPTDLVRDYLQLTRPRIVVMVLFALAVAACTCGTQLPAWTVLLHAIIGTGLVTGGSVALNQWFEYRSDSLMARTARRPIPAGRLSPQHGLTFGIVLSLSGLAYLAACSTPLVMSVAAISWVFYVVLYTPLKAISVWQLPVGAVAGAMPMLIGGSVADATFSPMAVSLFAIVFFWQFPHAIAIAWIYREHYAQAKLQVASVRDPSGRLAGWLGVFGAAVLVPVSLLPATMISRPGAFCVVAMLLSTLYLALSVRFLSRRDDVSARHLLWASFAHLPLLLVALLVTA
jgi:protoheme IX farnesyltransferase